MAYDLSDQGLWWVWPMISHDPESFYLADETDDCIAWAARAK